MGLKLLCYLLIALLVLPSNALAQSTNDDTPPALRTELTERGVSLKPVVLTPTKGVKTNATDLVRPQEYAHVLDNLQQLTQGVWTSRGIGHVKDRSSSFASGNAFRQIQPYSIATGGDRLLMHVYDKLILYNPADESEVDLYAAGVSNNINNTGTFAPFRPTQIWFTNGDLEPKKWDGNTANDFGNSVSWPVTIASIQYSKPKFAEVFAGRVVYANCVGETRAVVFSYYGDGDSFTVDSTALSAGAITFPAVLGQIKGMKALRIDTTSNEQVLLVGCERGFGLITGTSALNFSSVVLSTEFGLYSNRTWAQIGNDMYFLATDGVRKFSTSSGIATLANSAITFGLSDLINRINTSQAFQSFAVQHPSTQEVLWWVPIDSDTTPANAIVLNYNAYTPTDTNSPIFSTRSGSAFTCGTQIGSSVYYGSSSGYLYLGYSGDQFDGANFSWEYSSSLIGGSSPLQNCSMRRVEILTDGTDQSFTVTAYTLVQRSDGVTTLSSQDSRSVSVTSATVTKLGTWTSGTTTSYPKFIEFQPRGSGRFWKIRLTGSAGQHIALAGMVAVLTLGGWRQ